MVNIKEIKRALLSFSGRLLLGVISIHLLLIPMLLGLVIYFVNDTLKEQFISDSRSTSGLIASAIAPINPVTDKGLTLNLMDEVVLSGGVVFLEYELPGGEILNSIFSTANANKFHEDYSFGGNNDETYFISLPVRSQGLNKLSMLRIGFDEKPLDARLATIFQSLALIVLAYIVVNLLLVFVLGKRTVLPLKKLLYASRLIRSGQIETDLDIKSPVTDVRDLAVNLDLMRQELISQADELHYQAMHDSLTGLPNRALLENRMQQAILNCKKSSVSFSFLMMDLDRFKQVNDSLGHHAGDFILQQVATRLCALLREADTIVRLGGDEFAIILPCLNKNANSVAEKIAIEIERSFLVDGQEVSIGISIGIAHYVGQSDNTEELMRQADIAMYEAKKSGVRFRAYCPAYDAEALENLVLNNALHNAVSKNEIVLHYQPKIDLRTGMFKEVEALARWIRPDQGMVPPDIFIAIAEENGLIIELTNNLLLMAIKDAALWYHEGKPITVSVNLSPQNLLDDGLPARISDMLSDANLPAEFIRLEITESGIIQDPDRARARARARAILLSLKSMGINSVIDDFGTGYSSLVHLLDYPVSEIKIDKSFIINMIDDKSFHIVKAIIGMAHDLGLIVTAEGIENYDVFEQLQKLNCDIGQGYLYSKALPVDDLNLWRINYNRSQMRDVNAS